MNQEPTKFIPGNHYAIGISHLSKSIYECVRKTDKSVWFDIRGEIKQFKIKHDPRGEYFHSYPLWADSYGKQEREDRLD